MLIIIGIMKIKNVFQETLKAAISEMTTLLIEEEAFFIGKETGRLMRWGELEGLGVLEPVQPEFQIVEAPGVDIFGEPLAKKHIFECVCPRCHRTLAAQRFAPHLEKCMGMGRNSSRIASRRLAEGSSSQTSQNGNGAAASSTKGNDKPCSQTGNNASGSVAVAAGGTQQVTILLFNLYMIYFLIKKNIIIICVLIYL